MKEPLAVCGNFVKSGDWVYLHEILTKVALGSV